jgi:hypothetical protein
MISKIANTKYVIGNTIYKSANSVIPLSASVIGLGPKTKEENESKPLISAAT